MEALLDAMDLVGEFTLNLWLQPATTGRLTSSLAHKAAVLCLDAIALAEGAEPGILLEDEQDATGKAMSGAALGTLLADAGVVLALLPLALAPDAPQDAAQRLGDALAAAGVHTVLWHHALSAEGVRRSAAALLVSLVAGQTLDIAVADARTAVASLSHPWRPDAPADLAAGTAVTLYSPNPTTRLLQTRPQSEPGVDKVVRFPEPGLLPDWRNLPTEQQVGGLPAEPAHGMVGRGRELTALERALGDEQATSGTVIVYGYEGMGKSTLVAHAARWMVRTGRFQRVVYTNMTGGGHREGVLHDLGVRLIDESFTLHGADHEREVLQALVDTPTLVIWDHVDALLTDGEFGPAASLEALWQLGGRIAACGRSRLCLIADGPTLSREIRLPAPPALILEVGTLTENDAMTLWAAMLQEADADLWPGDDDRALASYLGEHPLALGIVAPQVAAHGAGATIRALEGVLPGLEQGEARLRNEALEVTLEAALRQLDDDTRAIVLPLGLFAGGMMEPLALRLLGAAETAWAEVKRRFGAAHLLHEERMPGLNAQYIRVHRALGRHLQRRMPMALRSELEPQFYGAYMGMMTWLSGVAVRSPDIAHTIARRELPNLRRALHVAMKGQQPGVATTYARQFQGLLEGLGFVEESESVAAMIRRAMAELVPAEGPLSRAGVQFLLEQIEQLTSGGRMADAGRALQQLVDRITRDGGLSYSGSEASLDQGTALHRFGRFLFTGGRADAALATYMRALRLLEELDKSAAGRRELVSLYEDMGQVYLALMQMDRAEGVLQKGLDLGRAPEDSRAIGAMHMQMGLIAAARQDFRMARWRFEQALEQMQVANDIAGIATIWNQLGALAWQLQELDEAEECYEQALEMARKADHVLMIAQAHMRLAQVTAGTGRPQVAQNHYAQAIRIYQENNLHPALASAEAALAELLLSLGELQNARVHAEAARAVAESLGPAGRHWEACFLLQRIAEAEGDGKKIDHWRARTREAFAASPEADRVRESWDQLISTVVQSCRGEAMDAETVDLVESLEKNEEWERLADAIWRILGGERGVDLYEYLDYIDALVIRTILDKLREDE
jgi:tetratricopeptide (TPR) repeat protein